ncbi:hypothetical protein AVEN_183436-1 [Araneus ventricosus]|uniref:ATP-dependent DNA helicase n=1 Tax=Araneus ventricosus TaxID=182803 RepID=A0A4Y2MUS1_ARAVE|nr:hypothetical protein AVEN_183436-1 [Araneus ventricosus]
MALMENARIRLGWVKAHIGIKGNQIADTLTKEATTDGIPTSLPFPKNFLKKQLLQLSLSRWQAEWDNGETGRSVYSIIPKLSNKQLHWSRECIQFATGHGPFPSYLKRFGLHPTDYCGCGEIGNPLHYATRWPLILSYHHKEPSPQFIVHGWKSALRNVHKNIECGEGGLFFMDASGGTGKTFLFNLLSAQTQKDKKVAIAVPSSGIAATLLDDGRTPHSVLQLPLNIAHEETPVCNITKNSERCRNVSAL